MALFLFATPALLCNPAVIFDLNGVLVGTKLLNTIWHIGPMRMLLYAGSGKNPFNARFILYDVLQSIEASKATTNPTLDDLGTQVPPLMVKWLEGRKKGGDVLQQIKAATNDYQFSNNLERSIIIALAALIFDPNIFLTTRKIFQESTEIIEWTKSLGFDVYILSNWDAESFELMKEKFSPFFDLFDGIIISGNVGLAKPNEKIFKLLLDTFAIDPAQALFIDDQKENADAAGAVGITAFESPRSKKHLLNTPDFKAMRQKIVRFKESLNGATSTSSQSPAKQ